MTKKTIQPPVISPDGRRIDLPGWTPWQAEVLLAGFFARDLDALHRLRDEHQQAVHGGVSGDLASCFDCGFVTAALYDVSSLGRSLVHDFVRRNHDDPPTSVS